MNRSQLIAHTKDYMDMLVQGIDPISGERITDDSVVLQPRMQKCFAYVSQLLDELMKNNGFVALDPGDAGRYEVVEKKAAFSLSVDTLNTIPVLPHFITPNAFLKNINRHVDAKRMEKLSITAINAYLLAQGYITETKEAATIRKTIRRPSERSAEIGIVEQELIDDLTGEAKHQLVFSPKAQEFLLAHLDEIADLQKT